MVSLKIFGSLLGFMAIVGTMGPVGIAINGGVIVLSAFNEDSQARLGERDPFWQPLAIAIARGIGGSPILVAPYFPPAAYLLLNRNKTYKYNSIS